MAAVAVAFIDTGELVMIPGNEIGGRIFTELGLDVHPTPDGLSGRYSIENLGDLLGDADVIVCTLDVDTATACYQESTLSVRWAASRVADALLA